MFQFRTETVENLSKNHVPQRALVLHVEHTEQQPERVAAEGQHAEEREPGQAETDEQVVEEGVDGQRGHDEDADVHQPHQRHARARDAGRQLQPVHNGVAAALLVRDLQVVQCSRLQVVVVLEAVQNFIAVACKTNEQELENYKCLQLGS